MSKATEGQMTLPQVKGQRIGYTRVSSAGQKPDRQDLGVCDKVFNDVWSGATDDRPGLKALMSHIREGDHVVVWSIDRLARSVIDLRGTVSEIVGQGASIEFLSEKLVFSKQEQNPAGQLMLTVLGGIAEFERSLINKRQAEGIDKAKSKGVRFGRPRAAKVEDIRQYYISSGYPAPANIASVFGCSVSTAYRALRDFPPYLRNRGLSPTEKRLTED